MEFNLRNRTLFIIVLVILGAGLASIATKYLKDNPTIQHHVSTGKVGTNPDGTVWIAEYIKGDKVLNYTLPYSSVHSKFLTKEFTFIIVVPDYHQEFTLVPDETSTPPFRVYIPEFDVTVALGDIGMIYREQGQMTELNYVYWILEPAFNDIRVRALIQDETFNINGLVAQIHKDFSVTRSGIILEVNNQFYLVRVDVQRGRVLEFKEIKLEAT